MQLGGGVVGDDRRQLGDRRRESGDPVVVGVVDVVYPALDRLPPTRLEAAADHSVGEAEGEGLPT